MLVHQYSPIWQLHYITTIVLRSRLLSTQYRSELIETIDKIYTELLDFNASKCLVILIRLSVET